jgi:hypothetical protein
MKKNEVHQAFLSMLLLISCPNPHHEPLVYFNHLIESGSKKKEKSVFPGISGSSAEKAGLGANSIGARLARMVR